MTGDSTAAVRLEQPTVQAFRDRVLQNAAAGALHHGRVFALMYDISGQLHEGLVERVEGDWRRLVDTLRLTEHPRYLRHRGRPVLSIWGFGFRDRNVTPDQAERLIDFFRQNPDPRYRVTLVGGVPGRWRTLGMDSLEDPRWAAVYRSFDVLSPWTVGRFRDEASVDRFYEEEVAPDLVETRRLGIDYLPVVFPGFSWHNMKREAPLNEIPRRGGRFLGGGLPCPLGLAEPAPPVREDALVAGGGTCIIGPDGAIIAGPVFDRETIVVADLDLGRIAGETLALDVTGHYNRPDVFEFRVRRP